MKIEWARYVPTPEFAKGPPPKNSLYRKGLKYESRVKARLQELFPHAIMGPWIAYSARGIGEGICQPDALIPGSCVIEVKLSYRHAAEVKLAQLYKPLVEFIEGKPHHHIQVTRRLTRNLGIDLTPIEELDKLQGDSHYHVVHFL